MNKQGRNSEGDGLRHRGKRSDELRRRAELLLGDLTGAMTTETGRGLHEVLHELHVHQIELELQNEELQQAQKMLEQSRLGYMRLYHGAPIGYVVLDSAGIIRKVNKTFSSMIGDPPVSIAGTPMADFLYAEDRPVFLARLRSFQKKPSDKQIDIRLESPQGPRFVSLRALLDEGSTASDDKPEEGLLVTITDIHERKTFEREIKERQQELETILTEMSDGFISLDRRFRIRYFNTAAEQFLDRDRQAVIGRGFFDEFPEARGSLFETNYRAVLQENRPVGFEVLFTPHNEWYEVHAAPFQDGLTVFFRVVTDRKRAEQAIADSERRFRSYLAHAPYGVFVTDAHGRCRQVNPAACSMTGYDESELLTMGIDEMLTPESRERGEAHFQQVMEQGIARGEVELVRKDGEARWCSVSAVKVSDDQCLGFVEDISERRQNRDRLLRSQRELALNHRIATIFLTSPDDELFDEVLDLLLETFASSVGLFGYINEDGDLVCPTMTRWVWEKCQVPGKSMIFPHQQWGGIWGRALREHRSIMANEAVRLPDGHLPLANVMAVPIIQREQAIGHFIVANKGGGYSQDDLALLEAVASQVAPILRAHLDRLRRRELQGQLEAVNRQLHKNESLGRMAGAMAHNYNNMLTVILGNLEVALLDLPPGDSHVGTILGDALHAAKRLSDLGTMMLTYLGQSPSASTYPIIDLARLVERYAQGREHGRPENVTISARMPAEPVLVAADPDMVTKLLDSLFANAVEALGGEDGLVEIKLSTVEGAEIAGGRQFPVDWQPLSTTYACVRILDTGHGISEGDLERIFDPFFTRKFTGRGMGLPLALGIVRMHQGGFLVHSAPGKGSIFKIFLPLANE